MTTDIDAIRKLTDAATDGPWVAHDDGLVWTEQPIPGDPVSGSVWLPDSRFIAAARTLLPACADELEKLRAELADLKSAPWSMPAEPTDITAVHDRNGQLWVCPGRPGDNLWWRDQLGRGIGYEWHQLLGALGPLTPATEHRCPNCAPGYDCERGIYTPAVAS